MTYSIFSSDQNLLAGKAKKFSLREVTFVNGRVAGVGEARQPELSSDGFPEEMEYILRLEDQPEVSLHLVRNRRLNLPDVYRQNQDGTFEVEKANEKKNKVLSSLDK